MFVDPPDTVVRTPALLIVATPVFEEFQVYVNVGVPAALEVREIEFPIQTALPPEIAFATGGVLTTIARTFDSAAPVQTPVQLTLASRLYQVVCVVNPGS